MVLDIFPIVADSILSYPIAIFYNTKKPESLPTPVFLAFLKFSVAFLESFISEEKELPVAAG